MNTKALVVIDLQNDITKNYRGIIENVNAAITRAQENGLMVIYIQHNNVTAGSAPLNLVRTARNLFPN